MATGNLEVKIVLKQTVLHGSNDPVALQRVAIVYIDGAEYRVSAPPEAKGKALEWASHFTVTQLVDFNSEVEIQDALGVLASKVVKDELENRLSATKTQGMHPDGDHCDAQICLKGHVVHCDGMPFDSKNHCTKCGVPCIDECVHCGEPIRGAEIYKSPDDYSRPQFCHGCGRPYPWMEDLLRTARELLDHVDKLSLEERKILWDDLQYVLSDPKAHLAPAKRKLIEIKLAKLPGYVRDVILDLMAKTAAEVLKG